MFVLGNELLVGDWSSLEEGVEEDDDHLTEVDTTSEEFQDLITKSLVAGLQEALGDGDLVKGIIRQKICILYGFSHQMDFSHHESPNPTRVACDEGGIRR